MNEIIQKMERFCAHRDRSEKDARLKLHSFWQSESTNEEIIQYLKNGKFIDDERLTKNYVFSKFQSAQWGKIKIKTQLQQKGIDDKIIQQYLDAIDEDHYQKMIQNVIDKWMKVNPLDNENKTKLYRFLISRGYENEIIMKQEIFI